MVDENRIEGAARNIGGKIQDAVGDLTGDAGTQLKGKANQAMGKVQNSAGSAADEARNLGENLAAAVQDQPLMFLGIALGIGVLIGFMLRAD